MSRADRKLLKDRDPAKRKSAIKRLAREVDRDALKQLAVMCADDRNPEVRQLALKAGVYIRQQLGELPQTEAQADGKSSKIHVDPKDAAKAEQLLSEAMRYQIAGERPKMLKILQQVLSLDPNQRHEQYFISLCESATGGAGAASVDMLNDDTHYDTMVETDSRQRLQREVEMHMDVVNKTTWMDVVFDLVLLFVIVTVGALISYFVMIEGAGRYQQSLDENRADVALARSEGRIVPEEEGQTQTVYYTERGAGGQYEGTFTLTQPDAAFMAQVDYLNESVRMFDVLGFGLGAGIAITLAVGLGALLAHLFGGVLFRGIGSLPHTAHKIVALFNGRLSMLLFILVIGTVIVFASGGGMMITILAGVVGLFALMLVLNLAATVGGAYNFGTAQGLIGAMPSVVLVGAVTFYMLEFSLGFIDMV
jgi:hypothetical protein